MFLSNIRCIQPPFRKSHSDGLQWLAESYIRYQKKQTYSIAEYHRLLDRVACSADQISQRFHFLPDFQAGESPVVFKEERSEGALVRQNFFQEVSRKIFSDLYQENPLPSHLIHVSCTGYVSPSGAQLIAAEKSPETVVTHSYHMGCYGAFPALRMASGFITSPQIENANGVDIVHTELCTLHMTPEDPTLEQMVIQSLFADGVAAYHVSRMKTNHPSLEVLHLGEFIIPNSSEAMQWVVADQGMSMTLSKDVPKLVGAALRENLLRWEKQTGASVLKDLSKMIVAVHPGGPKILDSVKNLLELEENQIRHSREVLYQHGNMSSATVPHIWKSILEDSQVPTGTLILSMAFGPGLTLCLSLMRVHK